MKKFFLSAMLMGAVCMLQAQKIEGSVEPLKGQSSINFVFDYYGVTYDGDSEADFFADKAKDKDNPEKWKADWVSTFRTDIWQKRFIDDFNESAEKIKLTYSAKATEFTAIIKITDIDPGNFAGPMSNPAKLTGNIAIVKTANKETIATITFKNYPGNPYEMTPVDEKRVGAAFGLLGKMFGKTLAKKLK